MNSIIPLIILFSASYLGYRIFEAIHFPASRIVGPIFVVALIQLLGFSVVVPNIFKMIFSIIFGTYLGLRFDKIAQKQLLKSIIPAMFLSVTYIFITILYGNLLTSVSNLDQNTSFLSVIPGGVAEAGVLAVSFNANLAQVSAFQLIRFLSIVLIMPIISKIIILPLVKGKSKTLSKQNPYQKIEEKTPDKIKSSNRQITYSSL